MPKALNRIAPGEYQDEIFLDGGREAKLPGFDPLFGRWIKYLRDNAAADNTVSSYAMSFRICVLFLTEVVGGAASVDAFSRLRPDDIERMQQAMLDQGLQPNTIVAKMAALHSFARFLHTHCSTRCDGVIISRLLVHGRSKRHVPANEDRDNLLEGTLGDDLDSSWQEIRTRALIMLLSTDGFKVGEALGLDFRDVDLRRCAALIRKGPRSRIARLSSSTARAIKEYLAVCPFNVCDAWPLFVGKHGERLSDRSAQLSITALRNQLGLHEQTTSNSLRSGRILELRASGHNDIAIMEEMGLSSRMSLEGVLANTPPNYAAIELAIRHVHESFAPASATLNGDRHPQVIPTQQPSGQEIRPGRRGRRKRMASVQDADAASYIDHIFNRKPHNTAVSYSCVIRQFADEFLTSLQKQVRTANSEDIAAFQQARNVTRVASAAVDRAALKDFYIFLFDRGSIATIPVLDLKPDPPRKVRFRDAASIVDVRVWVRNLCEYTKLHPADLEVARLQAFVLLLALQGLKSNEVLSLRKSALTGDTLQVKDRTLTMAPHTKAALEILFSLSDSAVDLIFPGREASQARNHRTMLCCLKEIQQKLDLPKVTPEQFTQAFRRNLFAILGDAVETSKAVGLRGSDQFAAGQRPQVAREVETEQHPMIKLM